jgi:glucan phosphorylase
MMTEEQRKLDALTGRASDETMTQGSNVESKANDIKAKAETAKDAVVGSAQQLKDQVTSAGQNVKERAQTVIDEGKGKLTSSLDAVASTLGKTTESLQSNELGQLAPYGEKLQYWTQGLSDYVKNANAGDLLRDAETLARRQPVLFLGGAFALGLLAARFLKSSSAGTMPRESYASGARYDSGAAYE